MRMTFHPILFAIIPPLFILVNNLDEVNYRDIFLPLLVIVAISLALWFILKIILKNTIKSALIVSLGLVSFFSYGHYFNLIYEFAKDLGFGQNRYLLVPFIVTLVVGTIYLIKTQRLLNNLNTITNVMSLAIIFIIIINIGTFEFQNSNIFLKNTESVELIRPESPPDVYYIILDKYAGAITLNELFNYNNHEFLDFLKSRGFQMSNESYSNYPSTTNSLASSLNMNYVHNLIDVPSNFTSDWPNNYLTSNNMVMKNFKSLGYEIVVFNSGISLTDTLPAEDKNLCGQEFLNYDILNQLFETSMLNPISVFLSHDQIRENRLCVFSELTKIVPQMNKPVFVFAHMMLPHSPYIFGENGERVNPESLVVKLEGDDDNYLGYLDQLKFTNKKMRETINGILENSETKPIIIIQSDHGYNSGFDWEYTFENNDSKMIKQAMRNINAYYLPQEGGSAFYDGITPVNTFRIIFNEYFGGNYPLLEDKMYFNTYDRPNAYKDVTSFIDKRK